MSPQTIVNRVVEVVSPPAMGAATKAMAELGVAGLIGNYCVEKGLVDSESIGALSKTSFSILLPCFLGTGIIKTIVSQQQQQQQAGGGILNMEMLSPPLLAVLHAFLLFQCCYHILLPLIGIDKDTTRGRSTAVSCSFGNSGVIPLIFSEALFRNKPNVLAQCYSGVSLYLVGWSPFFWSFGRSMLIGNSAGDDGDDSQYYDDKKVSPLDKLTTQVKHLASPPVKGVLVGMTLASVPVVGKLLVDGDSPLSIAFNSFQNLGRAANPLGLLVLTSSLAMGIATAKSNSADGTASPSPPWIATNTKQLSALQRWSCVSLARFVISPPLMLGLLLLFERIGLIASSANNPVIWFVLLLQSCMPPAQNSVLMLQVADKPEEANRMAQFLFGMYATSMLPVIIIVGIILQVFNLTN